MEKNQRSVDKTAETQGFFVYISVKTFRIHHRQKYL